LVEEGEERSELRRGVRGVQGVGKQDFRGFWKRCVVMVEEREEEEKQWNKIRELGKGDLRGRGNMLREGAIRKLTGKAQ